MNELSKQVVMHWNPLGVFIVTSGKEQKSKHWIIPFITIKYSQEFKQKRLTGEYEFEIHWREQLPYVLKSYWLKHWESQ